MAAIKKIDYKRELRELFAPGGEPVVVDVPDLTYLMIDGHGDPNTAPEFSEAIEALRGRLQGEVRRQARARGHRLRRHAA